MKRARIDKKNIIKKRIEYRRNNIVFLNDKKNNTSSMSSINNSRRKGILEKNKTGLTAVPYEKSVDYDIIICIPSLDRYEKVTRLISQFNEQPTKYSFKIILLNDGSSDSNYDKIPEIFNNVTYLKNEQPNGKVYHWYCYNQLWENIKNISCYAVLQMDDDFILCDDFLDTIVDLYFTEKVKNPKVMAIAPHLWSFHLEKEYESWWKRTDFVDGIALIEEGVIKYMNYQMKPVDVEEVSKVGAPVKAWAQISRAVVEMRGIIYRTDKSLVYHDGNDDSKLHGDLRINGEKYIYTQKFIKNL